MIYSFCLSMAKCQIISQQISVRDTIGRFLGFCAMKNNTRVPQCVCWTDFLLQVFVCWFVCQFSLTLSLCPYFRQLSVSFIIG